MNKNILIKKYIKQLINEQIDINSIKEEAVVNAQKLGIHKNTNFSSQNLSKLIQFLSMYENTDILEIVVDSALNLQSISTTKNRLVYEINNEFVLKIDTEHISNTNINYDINQIEVETRDNKVSGLYPFIPQVIAVAKNKTWIITEKVTALNASKHDPREFTIEWINGLNGKNSNGIEFLNMLLSLREMEFTSPTFILNIIINMCKRRSYFHEFLQKTNEEIINIGPQQARTLRTMIDNDSVLSYDLSIEYPDYFAIDKSPEDKIKIFNNLRKVINDFYSSPFISKIIQYDAYRDLAIRNIGFGYDGRSLMLDWGIDDEAYNKMQYGK
jgi:hypothetical protein